SFNLTNGSYLLTVSADGFVPTVAPTTIAGVPVELNISLVPVTPVVFPVSGEVSNASSGAPLAGATVLVNGTNASVTSVAGMYALALPNGTYRLEAEEPGFVTAATTVRVANGPVVANFSLNRSLPSYFSISGTVTAASSATPVAGALVTTDRGGSSTTDAAGRYVLDVENGTYLVTVNASGYSPQTTAVVVS
ncbi:MAG: carboxypeptidase regulatory-like domain-containing protein, partial [Thermoplasmata archaeon]|nr:carboxypeptidase regulatory-like domain-containing protein [Thermoplasmata archaeon]